MRKTNLVLILAVLSIFIACDNGTEGVEESITISASELSSSGGTSSWESFSESSRSIMTIQDDGLFSYIDSVDNGDVDPAEQIGAELENIMAKATELMLGIKNFSAEENSINWSMSYRDLNLYYATVDTFSASLNVNGSYTSDGEDNTLQSMTGSGQYLVRTHANKSFLQSQNSALKDLVVRSQASMTGTNDASAFSGSYNISVNLGAAICDTEGLGGKIIVSMACSSNSISIDIDTIDPNHNWSDEEYIDFFIEKLNSSLSLTVKGYDDDNAEIFSQNFSSIDQFMNFLKKSSAKKSGE